MDRGVRDRIVKGVPGRGIPALLLFALLILQTGCHWGTRGGIPPPPGPEIISGDNAASTESRGGAGVVEGPHESPGSVPPGEMEWLPPAIATDGAGETFGTSPFDNSVIDNAAIGALPPATTLPEDKEKADVSAAIDNTSTALSSHSPAPAFDRTIPAEATPSVRKPKPAVATHALLASASKDVAVASLPCWARSPEELVYRVDFIGITMGYARFRYKGKVTIAGKQAYHLNVRAWTSGVLSYIYPINETIDYYLDAETLAPIRQEFTQREKGKDDVAIYNQATGKITYRYRESGAIRKQVDTIPSVYDPVSVAYYFRWRDLGVESRPRNVYAGRKVYQISSRILGNERIRTASGEVDTIAVLPLIRRDGKPDNKGDLKIWFSSDERRVPVRLYAKFRKIKDWTLVGELMPVSAKAGG